MKILITGAKGFSAFYLNAFLCQNPCYELFSIDIEDCDLTQYSQTKKLLSSVKPDQIYHLAGSFTNLYEKDYANNVLSTKNIFDSLLALKTRCRVLLIGSAAEYGVPQKNPVSEEEPAKPMTIYGLTKAFQTQLMQYYCAVYQLDIVMARTFNLKGKGISQKLFLGQLYHQIEQYKKGKIAALAFGRLNAQRDYIDVQDAVVQYHKIMNQGLPGNIYNVGSGKPIQMSDLLLEILQENHLSIPIVEAQKEDQSEVNAIFADIKKLHSL